MLDGGRAVQGVFGQGREGRVRGHGGVGQDAGRAGPRPVRHRRPGPPHEEDRVVRLDGDGHRGARRPEAPREGAERPGQPPQEHEGPQEERAHLLEHALQRRAGHGPPAHGAHADLERRVQRLDELRPRQAGGRGAPRGVDRPRRVGQPAPPPGARKGRRQRGGGGRRGPHEADRAQQRPPVRAPVPPHPLRRHPVEGRGAPPPPAAAVPPHARRDVRVPPPPVLPRRRVGHLREGPVQHHHAARVLRGVDGHRGGGTARGRADTIRPEQVRGPAADVRGDVQDPAPEPVHRLPALLRRAVDARRLLAVLRVHAVHDPDVRGHGGLLEDQEPQRP
mmetsp:Transcript_11044/g.23953  ORF Transcript_11044/g.23953 Transcript_11044/m.23953 type:complete len:335 (-) Transcript_11044:1713-2717(-)